jgi:hypothetical protein
LRISTNHSQAKPLFHKQLAPLQQELQSAPKKSTAQNWHNAAQKPNCVLATISHVPLSINGSRKSELPTAQQEMSNAEALNP